MLEQEKFINKYNSNQIQKSDKTSTKKGEVTLVKQILIKQEILNWKAEVKIESWIKDQIKFILNKID